MKLGLRNKFLLPTLAFIILGMGISTAVSYFKARNALVESAITAMSQLSDSTHDAMAAYIKDRKLDVASWSQQALYQNAAQDSFVGKAARKSANEEMARLMKEYGYYENISLADATGELVASGDESVVGKFNVKDREYYKKSMNGEVFVSDVLQSRGTGNPVFFISAPVKNKDAVVGVLTAVLDVNVFSKMFVDSVKNGKTGYAYLLRNDGLVIAHPDKSKILKTNVKDFDFGKKIIGKENGFFEYTFEGVDKLAAFQKDQETGWTAVVTSSTNELLTSVQELSYINVGVGSGVALLAAIFILLLVNSTVKPINRIVEGLTEGADQVAAASGQVASSSQQLAEGSSQQAAAVEETSSSLEEMASMTRQNADNAREADQIVKNSANDFREANSTMMELTGSMQDISHASEETQKIIKTIDEIAFQTNLLALNAAVEAARAGEAGAGFAVVADEVRNLAMRAADAAKNTAQLIEGTVVKVKKGSDLVSRANEAFARVSSGANKVGELVGEIAAASGEQAQGIEQINKAVAEMDKVTQRNAANAEESASASEEMSAQANQMKEFVSDLISVVEGVRESKKVKRLKRRDKSSEAEPYVSARDEERILSARRGGHTAKVTGKANGKTNSKNLLGSIKNAKELRPEQVIPLEAGDFDNF